jgi:hypothetical protein
MAITVATVIENMCLSSRRKADVVIFGSCIPTLASLTHFVAQKPDQTPAVQSVHNLSRIEAGFQNTVAAKPYAEMGRMSNQQKAELIGDIVHIQSSWGDHGKISPKT